MSCDDCSRCRSEYPMTDKEAFKPTTFYKVSAVLKDELWDPDLKRYLFVKDNKCIPVETKNVEYFEYSVWNLNEILDINRKDSQFKKVIVETLDEDKKV